jgi:hypothetical protein
VNKKQLYDLAAKRGVALHEKHVLLAPFGYWGLAKHQKSKICNGCGPGWLSFVVPDELLKISFREPCNIHDYCFKSPRCTFKLSNELFRYNLIIQVQKQDQNVWRWGYYISSLYYQAVKSIVGLICYWRSK